MEDIRDSTRDSRLNHPGRQVLESQVHASLESDTGLYQEGQRSLLADGGTAGERLKGQRPNAARSSGCLTPTGGSIG